MTQQADNQDKLESISAWVEQLHELENNAIAGRIMTDEEYNSRLQSVIDGSCFQKYLNNILQQKEETLKKLAALEETENYLRKTILEVQSFSKTQDS